MRRLLTTRRRWLVRSDKAHVHERIPCRDGRGRRAHITVHELPCGDVRVEFPAHGRVVVQPLDVGRLRRALRSAATSREQP